MPCPAFCLASILNGNSSTLRLPRRDFSNSWKKEVEPAPACIAESTGALMVCEAELGKSYYSHAL